MKHSEVQITEGSLAKNILIFSIPLALSNLLQVLFNMSDIAVVGQFAGSLALGSVGSCATLVSLFTGLLIGMGGGSGSDVGTGGMAAKLAAARIATDSGSDMIICNADDVNVIHELVNGEEKGTLFLAHPNRDFDLMDYINTKYEI